ncbi:MAG: hypothetical protein AAGM22_01585 [Acidobacteriota bacterium]
MNLRGHGEGGWTEFLSQRQFLIAHSAEIFGMASARVQPEDPQRWLLGLSFFPVDRQPQLRPTQVRLYDPEGRPAPAFEIHPVDAAEAKRMEAFDGVVFALVVNDAEAARRLAIDTTAYAVELVDVERLDPFFSRAALHFATPEDAVRDHTVVDRRQATPPPEDVDYLAKDYESFRTLMLDHMARAVPGWKERNPSDLGVTIVETLAYAADYVSYYQDAVGTEAYLQTARRRVSIRRHGVLLDYPLGEGCTPRAWVHVRLGEADAGPEDQIAWLPQGAQFMADGDTPAVIPYPSLDYDRRIRGGADVFETLYGTVLRPSMNRLEIYAWRVADYSLEPGATRATLRGDYLDRLAKGDVLCFEQAVGQDAARPHEVDLAKRHVVRLCAAPTAAQDPLDPTLELTEIEWFAEDALPFLLPVRRHQMRDRVLAVVRGNLVLADLGRTTFEALPAVPAARPYRPQLDQLGLRHRLVYHQPFVLASAVDEPASAAIERLEEEIVPALALAQLSGSSWIQHGALMDPIDGRRWSAARDLMRSGRFDRRFVVETENDGTVTLRFGDGQFGQRPEPETHFWAFYRVAQAARGAIGAGTAAQLVAAGTVSDSGTPAMPPDLEVRVMGASFPVGATGGSVAETNAHARLFAPGDVHRQERVVTAEDFTRRARALDEVWNAHAELQWGGSWTLAIVRVQRVGGRVADASFRNRVEAAFDGRLVMGYQLAVRPPRWVPLWIELAVRLTTQAEPRWVQRRLEAALGNGVTYEGDPAFFHPGAFTFGDDVALDDLVAAATDVDGILDVEVTVFRRLASTSGHELARGVIPIGPGEIAELTPEHGRLVLRWTDSA